MDNIGTGIANVNTAPSTALANALALPSVTTTTTGLQLLESMSNEEWLDLGVRIGRIGGAIQWWLGDWWAFGEERQWGEGREVAEQMGTHYGTICNYASVTRAFEFSCRHENLSFTHHQAAMAAPAKQRQRWLSRASKKGWSVSRLRKEIRQAEENATAVTDLTEAQSTAEEDRREPTGNDIDPTEAAGCRKSEYAAAEIEAETETGGEAKPDQAVAASATEDESVDTTPTIPATTTRSTRKDLLAAWDESPEDREILRTLALEEFFAQASGADIHDRIPDSRRKEVIGTFLDRLTVKLMLEVISPEFREQLCARLPAKLKGMTLAKTVDASGKTIHALEPRGNRSRH